MTSDRELHLVEILTEAKSVYYNTEETILSDEEYDKLEAELRSLNPNSDFFTKVGFKSRYGTTVVHEHRMRSMQKGNTIEDIQKFSGKMPEVKEWGWEHKIDGISIELEYDSRKLIQASTRGDGKEGQDVTHTINWVPNIPKQILFDQHVIIRGECILPKNTKIDTKGKPLRNIASGLVGRKEADADCTELRFISYNVISSKIKFLKETDKLSFLLEQGFDVVPGGTVKSLEDLQKVYVEYHTKIRESLPYEIDGLIVLPNDVSVQDKYEDGDEHHPFWAIAYKFPNQSKETELIGIAAEISRLGTWVPVGVFKPVQIGGSTIQNASLNNYENIKKLGIQIGDIVDLQKANDIIPYINKIVKKGNGPQPIPTHCPSCGTQLTHEGVHLVCKNHHGCKDQLVGKILYWVKSCDMDGVSDSTVKTLFEAGLVKSIKDLYELKESHLKGLEGFGESRIDNILSQVERTKVMTTAEFISRLGIPSVGKKAVDNLGIKTVQDFESFNDPTYSVGQKIIEWKSNPLNKEIIRDLLGCITIETKRQGHIKVCATGSAPIPRKELIKFLEDKGYEWVDSVGKDTQLLLTDDINSSSSKLVKAKKLGIEIKLYSDILS